MKSSNNTQHRYDIGYIFCILYILYVFKGVLCYVHGIYVCCTFREGKHKFPTVKGKGPTAPEHGSGQLFTRTTMNSQPVMKLSQFR